MWSYRYDPNHRKPCVISNSESGEELRFNDYEDAMYALSELNRAGPRAVNDDWRIPYVREFGESLRPGLGSIGEMFRNGGPCHACDDDCRTCLCF